METRVIREIVQQLIGPITPIGESHTDAVRLENLKALCEVVDGLADEIYLIKKYINSHGHSRREAARVATKFLQETLAAYTQEE